MGLTYPSNKICPRCGAGGYVWYLSNSEYVAKCTNCNHYFRRENFPMCVLDEASKPITNADRIRSMSDEELAEWLERIRLCCTTDLCGRSCPFAEVCYFNAEAPKEMLDWLKEEVKE